MPMLANGEIAIKVILLGPRGAAAHVLGHLPAAWQVERWSHEEGLGEPGEPPMDVTSFNVALEHAARKHRLHLFGHGISGDDFVTLGPGTRRAIFTRMDALVIVLDGQAPTFASCLSDDVAAPSVHASAIGVRGWTGAVPALGGRTVDVTSLADDAIAAWLERFARATMERAAHEV